MQYRRIHQKLPGGGPSVVLAAAALLGCQPSEPDGANEQNVVGDPILNLPALPLPAEPMRRAELLAAVRMAASAEASGADDAAEQRELDGRQFELRIRFGCRGPSPELDQAPLGWSFEPAKRTLRVRVAPTISAEDPIASRIAGEDVEAVEGFWIPRPWLLQPSCPAVAAVRTAAETKPAAEGAPTPERPAAKAAQPDAEGDETGEGGTQPPAAGQKIGIAQFFTETDSRTRRRDARAYEAVKVLAADQPTGSQGYDFVLSGRLRSLPGKRVIECVARGSDRPPDCIVSAQIDRVRIEQPESKQIVAEWSS
jgi:hypothetical protein